MIGAENTAFPRRYVAIGMPMLFAFAYVDDSDPTTTSPQGRCQRSFAQRREEHSDIGVAQDREHEERAQDEEGQPSQHVTAGLSEEVDAPDDISGDDRDADDRETREDA
jgi:hypothetical protein